MSSLKKLLEIISGIAPASANVTEVKKSDLNQVKTTLLSNEIKFKDGNLDSSASGLKIWLNNAAKVDALINKIKNKQIRVIVKQTPYGKVNQLEKDDKTFVDDGNPYNLWIIRLNKYPSVLNETLRDKFNASVDLKAPASASTGGVKTDRLNPMAGGSMEGEFEAIKNTFAIEKSTMEMIGGAEFAPALSPAATQKARVYQEMFDKLVEQLKQNGKALEKADNDAIQAAIDGLAKREREATVLLEYLKQYIAIMEQNKGNEEKEYTDALKGDDIQTFVGKYFKTLKRVEKKSAKILGVLGDLTSSVAVLPVML